MEFLKKKKKKFFFFFLEIHKINLGRTCFDRVSQKSRQTIFFLGLMQESTNFPNPDAGQPGGLLFVETPVGGGPQGGITGFFDV